MNWSLQVRMLVLIVCLAVTGLLVLPHIETLDATQQWVAWAIGFVGMACVGSIIVSLVYNWRDRR